MAQKRERGFAAMNPEKQREIASKGGRAAHQRGTAHEWDSTEAAAAGRKGGRASHRRNNAAQPGAAASQPIPSQPTDTGTPGGIPSGDESQLHQREAINPEPASHAGLTSAPEVPSRSGAPDDLARSSVNVQSRMHASGGDQIGRGLTASSQESSPIEREMHDRFTVRHHNQDQSRGFSGDNKSRGFTAES